MKGSFKRNVLIIGIIITLIFSISIPIFIIFFNPKNNSGVKSESDLNNELYQIFEGVYSKEDINSMSKEQKEDLLKASNDIDENTDTKDTKKKPIEGIEVDNFNSEIIGYSEKADFTTAIDEIKEFKESYSLNNINKKKIDNLEFDITSIIATLTVDESQRGKIIKNLKTPELLLLGTLFSSEKSRRDIITDKLSLSPIFDGQANILNIDKVLANDTNDNKVIFIKSNNDIAESVYKIDFAIENNKLTAYIIETSADTLELYGIYTPEGETNYYQTIEFWESIDS